MPEVAGLVRRPGGGCTTRWQVVPASDQPAEFSSSQFVINQLRPEKHRNTDGNFASASLTTRFRKIIERSGLTPWTRPWTNLRASRATELREAFPPHVVNAWTGHTNRIAEEHDTMVTDEHFQRASRKRSENRSGTAPPEERTGSQAQKLDSRKPVQCKEKRPHAKTCDRLNWTILDLNQ